MLSLPSVPQREPETFLYSNEVPALAHTFALIVSMLLLRSTSCWNHAPPVTYSFIPDPRKAQASPCTADFTQSLLLSWRGDQHPTFWAGSNLSLLSGACRNPICSRRSLSPPCRSCTDFFLWVALFWVWTWFRFKPGPPPCHGTCHLYSPLF